MKRFQSSEAHVMELQITNECPSTRAFWFTQDSNSGSTKSLVEQFRDGAESHSGR